MSATSAPGDGGTAKAAPAGFFRSRWVSPPPDLEQLDPSVLAPGFRAAGVACGLKGAGETDVGVLLCSTERVDSALALTANA